MSIPSGHYRNRRGVLKVIREKHKRTEEIRIRLSKRDLEQFDGLCRQWKVSRSLLFHAMLTRTLDWIQVTPEEELRMAVNALTDEK